MACAALSLLAVVSPDTGIFFGVMGSIFAGASVIAVDEPASPRTRRVALLAGSVAALVVVATVILMLTSARSGE